MRNAEYNLSKRLQQLSERLINITRRNKSIRLLRKAKRQCIDLAEIDALSPATAEEALRQVLRSASSVVLSWKDSPIDPRDERYQLLIDEEDEVEEVETHDFKRVKLFRKLDSNLTQLSRNARQIEEETGAVDLYLGFPWISGNCDDIEGTFLQAPAMLFPVRLKAQRSPRLEWVLEPRADSEPIFNEALVLALGQFHETKLADAFLDEATDAAESQDAGRDPCRLLNWLHDKLVELGLRMTEPERKLSTLPEYKADQVPKKTAGFTLKSHAVVGYFPQAGSALRQDYEVLVDQASAGDLPGVLGSLLDSSIESGDFDGDGVVDNADEIAEQDTCWIVESDASQEAAMLRSRSEDCLVIHGPPGTGKSQVICNLISDALARGERVVVCCQKRAALDVVAQRLSMAGLGNHVAVVHDHANDRAEFYQAVARTLEAGQEEHARELEQECARLARSIDSATTTLKTVAAELHKPRRCGHTARQLYALASTIKDDPDQDVLHAANQFDRPKLTAFLDRVRLLSDFNKNLPDRAAAWSGRKSFGRLSFADKSRIHEALVRALEATKTLMRAEETLGEQRPGASKAAACLESLNALSALGGNQVDSNTAGLARELMDASASGSTRAALEAVDRQLGKLAGLPPEPGPEFTDQPPELAVSMETWLMKRKGLFRVFSGEYRKARKATSDFAAREGIPFTADEIAKHAALIRSRIQWQRLRKSVNGSLLDAMIAGVSTVDGVETVVRQLRAALELKELVKGLLQQAAPLETDILRDGDAIEKISGRAAQLAALGEGFRLVNGAAEGLKEFLREEAIQRIVSNADQDAAVAYGLFERLRHALDHFDTLQSIDDVLDKMTQIEVAIYRHVRKRCAPQDWQKTIEQSIVLGWLAEVEKETRDLRRVSSGEIDSLRDHFREQLKQRRELNKKRLALKGVTTSVRVCRTAC